MKPTSWCSFSRLDSPSVLFRIVYNDGSVGGLVGPDVVLPQKRCKISQKSTILGNTVLIGAIEISGETTIVDTKIDNQSGDIFVIENSNIQKCSLVVSEHSEICDSEVSECSFLCSQLLIKETKAKKIVSHDKNDVFLSISFCKTEVEPKEKTVIRVIKTEDRNNVTLKTTDSVISGVSEMLFTGNCVVDISNSFFKEGNGSIINFIDTNTKLQNTVILPNFVGTIKGNNSFYRLVLHGDFSVSNANMLNSKILGTFISDAKSINVISSFFGDKTSCILEENVEKVKISKSRLTENSRIQTIFKRPECPAVYKNHHPQIKINFLIGKGDSKVNICDNMSMQNVSLMDLACVFNGNLKNCTLTGTSKVANIYLFDSELCDTSLGFYSDDSPIIGANAVGFYHIKRKTLLPVMLDFGNENECLVLQNDCANVFFRSKDQSSMAEKQYFSSAEEISKNTDIMLKRNPNIEFLIRDDYYFSSMENALKEILVPFGNFASEIITKISMYYYYLTIRSHVVSDFSDYKIFDCPIDYSMDEIAKIEDFLLMASKLDMKHKKFNGYKYLYFIPSFSLKVFEKHKEIENTIKEDKRFSLF